MVLPDAASSTFWPSLLTPSNRTCTDSPRASCICDATVLVVAAEKYRWQIAREAAEELVRAGALVPGAVLTRRRFHVPGWLYHRL